MVVTSLVPTLRTGVTHERAGTPLIWTVHAPHRAAPQPNFVPVRPRTSRNTQRTGVSPSTSTECIVPFTAIANGMFHEDRADMDRPQLDERIANTLVLWIVA